jgi:hypothetical protein
MPDAKVTIAMPYEGHVAPAALIGVAGLLVRAVRDKQLVSVTCSEGGVIDAARNRLVAGALSADTGMTHILWVDPTLVIPENALDALLAHGQPATAALCARRFESGWDSGYELEPLRPLPDPPDGPRRVGGAGLGCTLVEADLYRRLQARYRDETWYKRFYARSEDVYFFGRARQLGVGALVDPAVRCDLASSSVATKSAVTSAAPASDTGPSGGPRVALLVPLFEPVAPCAMTSMMAMIRHSVASGLLQGLYFTNGLFYDVARNSLVSDALAAAERFTHLLWIDSDMVVPHDTLDRLLDLDKPVVGGLYHTKRGNLHPAVFSLDPLRGYEGSLGGLSRVDGFGLGCTLVQRSVYEEMAAHFGDERWHVMGYESGEDVYFFERCKRMGIESWLDSTMRCGHVRDDVVTTQEWAAQQTTGTNPYVG